MQWVSGTLPPDLLFDFQGPFQIARNQNGGLVTPIPDGNARDPSVVSLAPTASIESENRSSRNWTMVLP